MKMMTMRKVRRSTDLMTGASDDRWEDCSGGVIPSKTGLAHTRSIVHDQSGNLVVTHVEQFKEEDEGCKKVQEVSVCERREECQNKEAGESEEEEEEGEEE
jgi:hypothetical protein